MRAVGARVLAWLKREEVAEVLVARAARGDALGVETLLDSNASPSDRDSDGLTPLYVATRGGHRDIVWLLLQRGADVWAEMPDGDTALACAAARGDADICNKLLAHGASPRQLGANGTSPLGWAARGDHVAVMRTLLAHGASECHGADGGATYETETRSRLATG